MPYRVTGSNNQHSTPGRSGTMTNRPTAALASGQLYYSTDQKQLAFSDGSSWIVMRDAPRGHIAGLEMSVEATRDTLIQKGSCRVGTSSAPDQYTAYLDTVLTKKLDATWAAGDDVGGMDDTNWAGAGNTANQWWHVFILHNVSTGDVDAGFDTSVTAANLLADSAVVSDGLTMYRRIGAVKETAAADGTQETYVQHGDEFWWLEHPGLDYDSGSADHTGSTQTITLTDVPLGVRVVAHFVAQHSANANHSLMWIAGGTMTNPSTTASPLAEFAQFGASATSPGRKSMLTSTTGTISWRVTTDTSTQLRIETHGYTDNRGKDL